MKEHIKFIYFLMFVIIILIALSINKVNNIVQSNKSEIYRHNFTSNTDELIFVLNKHKNNVNYDVTVSDYNMRSTVEVKCQVKGTRYIVCITAAKGIPEANNTLNKEVILYDEKVIDFIFVSPFNAIMSKINNPQGVTIEKAIESGTNQITISDEKQEEIIKVCYTDELIVTCVKKYKKGNLFVEAYFKNWVFLKNDI